MGTQGSLRGRHEAGGRMQSRQGRQGTFALRASVGAAQINSASATAAIMASASFDERAIAAPPLLSFGISACFLFTLHGSVWPSPFSSSKVTLFLRQRWPAPWLEAFSVARSGMAGLQRLVLVLVLAALSGLPCAIPASLSGGQQVHHYGLELASADVSWQACRSAADPDFDAHFPSVCAKQAAGASPASRLNPLHVAVTVSATWWAAPGTLGPNGAGRWTAGAHPTQDYLLLPREAGSALERRIAWKAVGDDDWTPVPTCTPSSPGCTDAFPFAVTHAQYLSTKTNASLHHVSTRFSFMVELPRAGEYEVAFTGCCRYVDLANIRQQNYPHQVPWRVAAHIAASTDSALAPSFSPRLAMPITQVVMWHQTRRAFRLMADHGGALVSLLDEEDVSGRYLETPIKLSLDSSAYVTTDTVYSAYVREDKNKSIVWFAAGETGRNQFAAIGAWASGPGWAVVRGDVTTLQGKRPVAKSSKLPVLEGLGGTWPDLPFYEQLRTMGPWYGGGGAVRLAAKRTPARVEYEHVVHLQHFLPGNALLPSLLALGAPTFELGTLPEPAFVPAGTLLDPSEGVLILPPGPYKSMCTDARTRAPDIKVCATVLAVQARMAVPGIGQMAAGLDLWIQILEPVPLQATGATGRWGSNPLPYLGSPVDSGANSGMGAYSTADTALQMTCDQDQTVVLPIHALPSLAVMKANKTDQSDGSKAFPIGASAAVQPDSRLDVRPAWQSSYAWQPPISHAVVKTNQVELSLAPKCSVFNGNGRPGGLQMLCVQLTYWLDDQVLSGVGDTAAWSNFGCNLENPSLPGRCFVTSSSRCVFVHVSPSSPRPYNRTTVLPQATATPPPSTTPQPSQPVVEAVTKLAASSLGDGMTHVLDLKPPDPLAQIKAGELSLFFVEDLAQVPLGRPPVDTLRTVFDAQSTACLCAGSRDLSLQRALIDKWNKESNDMDSPTRAVWYKMGKELRGQQVELKDGKGVLRRYQWTCISEAKLNVRKALTSEMVVNRTQGCVLCWREADGKQC